jgi:hypothetical protein
MSPRTAKGLKWFKWVAWVAALGFSAMAVTAIIIGHPIKPPHIHAIDTIAAKLAGFVGATLFWGGIAFAIGWLTGGKKSMDQD